MFKIGDKVRVTKNYCLAETGTEGIIRDVPGDNGAGKYGNFYAVEFKAPFKSHDCDGKVPSGRGHWLRPECLELIASAHAEKIVITHDGKTTLARLYSGKTVVESAEANCFPDDEFDFVTGAKIAFERLVEEKKEPPFKVGDIVKVKAGGYHHFMTGTVGRVIRCETNRVEVKAYRPDKDDLITQTIHLADCEKVV